MCFGLGGACEHSYSGASTVGAWVWLFAESSKTGEDEVVFMCLDRLKLL